MVDHVTVGAGLVGGYSDCGVWIHATPTSVSKPRFIRRIRFHYDRPTRQKMQRRSLHDLAHSCFQLVVLGGLALCHGAGNNGK